MTTILDIRPAGPGWRVAVAWWAPTPDLQSAEVRPIQEVPLIGWALVELADGATTWLPCWWDDLGVTTGNPWQEVAWPIGPGEVLNAELRMHLNTEVTALMDARAARGGAAS